MKKSCFLVVYFPRENTVQKKFHFCVCEGNRMNLTVEYLTTPISLFLLLFASTKSTKKPHSFWSSDCSVLPLMLTSFSTLRKVALQSTMREHVLVYFKYRQCLVCLQVLSMTKNPALKTRQIISHKHSNEYCKQQTNSFRKDLCNRKLSLRYRQKTKKQLF